MKYNLQIFTIINIFLLLFNNSQNVYSFNHNALKDNLPYYSGIPTGPAEPPLKLNWPVIVQPVSFHILYKSDGTGLINNNTIINQIKTLNDAFSGLDAKQKKYKYPTNTNIIFILENVDYTLNDEYFDKCALWNYQPIIKQKLFIPKTYNIYSCNVPSNLGLSIIPYQLNKILDNPYIPQPLNENHWYLGTLIDYRLLTGSKTFNGRWKQGLMLVHETGHYYGLLHIYQGGCILDESASDNIADTPRQNNNPSKSCKALLNYSSCPKLKKLDDNSNYMSINFDNCRSHFTPGQVSYMRYIISLYKPLLNSNIQ